MLGRSVLACLSVQACNIRGSELTKMDLPLVGINKYVIVEKSVLLMILVFVDRMCALYPTFTINSLTAHRYAEKTGFLALPFVSLMHVFF